MDKFINKRTYIKTVADPLTLTKGGIETVIFPMVKTIPEDNIHIATSSFVIKDSTGLPVQTSSGVVVGNLIAGFPVNTTILSGLYQLTGTITLSSGDTLVHTQNIEVS